MELTINHRGCGFDTEIDTSIIKSSKELHRFIGEIKKQMDRDIDEMFNFLSHNLEYEIIENTNHVLHVSQRIGPLRAAPLPIEKWDFSWRIEKKAEGRYKKEVYYETDITRNKDKRDGREYPARWPSIERTFWEYDKYMLPFSLWSKRNGLISEIKLDGWRGVANAP